jgi:hypothetical protein
MKDRQAELAALELSLDDPYLIPTILDLPLATAIATLLQISLHDPAVRAQLPTLYQIVRPFVDLLVEAIARRSGDDADDIRTTFAEGWFEENDVTKAEFDRHFTDDSNDVELN